MVQSWVGSLKTKQEHPFLPDAEIGESGRLPLFQAPRFTSHSNQMHRSPKQVAGCQFDFWVCFSATWLVGLLLQWKSKGGSAL